MRERRFSVNLKCNSTHSILIQSFFCVFALFLLFCPVFYIDLLATLAEKNLPLSYLLLRLVRFGLALFLGYRLRRANRALICGQEQTRRRAVLLLVTVAVIAGLLVYTDTALTFYATLTHRLGLTHPAPSMYFWAVCWEQLASGDFFWSLLACLGVLFGKRPTEKSIKHKMETEK